MGGLATFTSCVDDKYDLDNVDTTFGVKLDNLVVPVNLSTITLDKVLDVDDDSLIEKFPEGASPENQYYAIRKSGSFEADPVFVDLLETLNDATIRPYNLPVVNSIVMPLNTHYSYLINNVDEALVNLTYLALDEKPMEINLKVTTQGGNPVNIKNLVIQLPEFFVAYYNGKKIENNFLEIAELPSGTLPQPIQVAALDYTKSPLTPLKRNPYDTKKYLDIAGDDIGIRSATLDVTDVSEITASFSMSGFIANNVSGNIDYKIDAPKIAPVSLSDLPDFLKDGNSNLILSNPQLYLDFENPLGAYYNFDINIVPSGNNGTPIYESLSPFITQFALAVNSNDLALGDDYRDLVKQSSQQMKYILAGEGLPEEISFSLANASLAGEVKDFELGRNLQIAGSYTFFSPLSFDEGSQIIYTDKETDFFGDDLSQINVEYLRLSAYPVSTIPFAVQLEVYPLNHEGEHIKDANGREVMASGAVSAYASGNEVLEILFDQPFTGLDGVEFNVVVNNLNGDKLSPSQTITLNDIKAKITGDYLSIDDKYKEDYK